MVCICFPLQSNESLFTMRKSNRTWFCQFANSKHPYFKTISEILLKIVFSFKNLTVAWKSIKCRIGRETIQFELDRRSGIFKSVLTSSSHEIFSHFLKTWKKCFIFISLDLISAEKHKLTSKALQRYLRQETALCSRFYLESKQNLKIVMTTWACTDFSVLFIINFCNYFYASKAEWQ